jgi:diguanylate cyclase (GGDEF)-like protein/PAS domain S-box-containing protein
MDSERSQDVAEEPGRRVRGLGRDRIGRAVLDVVGAVVMAADPTGRVRYFNRAAEELTGYAEEDVLGQSVWDLLIPPEEAPGARDAFARLVAGNFPHRYENDWLTRDGGRRRIAFVNTFLRDATGRVELVIGTGVDVTEQREAQELLEGMLTAITEQSVIATDLHGRITVFNTGAERMLGHHAEEVLGADVTELLHDPAELGERGRLLHTAGGFPVLVAAAERGGAGTGDWTYRRRDGTPVTVALSLTLLRSRTGRSRGYLCVAVDVTAERERERALDEAAAAAAHRAAHDPLTGLPNRSIYLDRLQHAVAAHRRHHRLSGVLFLDLDGLKAVNDTHGHAAGDALIVEVAERLTAALREGDLCARLAGDEFAVLVEDVHGRSEVDRVVQRIERLLGESPVVLPSGRTTVAAASIGSTMTHDTDGDPQEVLARADAAMYRAKTQRRAGSAGGPPIRE